MAYNIFPKNEKEIENLKLDSQKKSELKELLKFIQTKYKIKDPIALDENYFKKQKMPIKIIRALDGEINLKNLSKDFSSLSLSFGNGSRGNSGANNQGNLFEKELNKDIQNYIDGNDDKIKYKDAIKDLINLLDKDETIIATRVDGGKNQKRPLNPSTMIIGKKGDIGKTVTDVTITVENTKTVKTKEIYLSLKTSGTVTFLNSGVKKFFIEKEMKENKLNSKAKSILETFGIDEIKFCNIFNNYDPKKSKKSAAKEKVKTNKIDKTKLKNFLESGIGYGYIYVHKNKNKVKIIDLRKKETLDKLIKPKFPFIIEYPKNGEAKRIDVLFETEYLKFKMNIRNKQGKIYPTHIMLDYNFIKYP